MHATGNGKGRVRLLGLERPLQPQKVLTEQEVEGPEGPCWSLGGHEISRAEAARGEG